MGKLIYPMITSLDGFVAIEDGNFDLAVADDEFHTFINYQSREVGILVQGRRMYDTMLYWGTAPYQADLPVHIADWARLWWAADKIVISGSLTVPLSQRTRIEHSIDAEMVRALNLETEQ